MKKSPEWKDLVHIGHTLVYDLAVLGDGTFPVDVAKNISIPTLVIAGEKSFDFVHATADTLEKVIPRAARKTLKDQTHFAAPEAVAPVLMDFFATPSK